MSTPPTGGSVSTLEQAARDDPQHSIESGSRQVPAGAAFVLTIHPEKEPPWIPSVQRMQSPQNCSFLFLSRGYLFVPFAYLPLSSLDGVHRLPAGF